MVMKNDKYWKKRFEILEDAELKKAERYLQTLEEQYRIASEEIEKQLSKWYTRFSVNNNVSMNEAKRLLNTRELAEFRWSVQDYIKHGQENALTQQWMKQLENASARVHVSRLDALKVQLQQQVEVLYGNQVDGIEKLAKNIYSDGYYHTAFEIQQGFNVGYDLQQINDAQLAKVLSRPWTTDMNTFRDRCWTNKQQLVSTVHTQLTQGIMRGDAPDKAIKNIAGRFQVDKRKAGRLVMTESAFFASTAQKDAFKALGVEQFEIVATLDNMTSEICQSLDGHVFDMKDYEPGVTAPPFHPWCRTTTVPYFDDDFGERAARGADGEVYYVPSDMKYADWKDKFVDGCSTAGLSKIDRLTVISNIMNTNAINQFDDVHKNLIKMDLENASDVNLQIVQASIDKLHLNLKGTGTCFYRPGSGYLEMNLNDPPIENIRVFWHEYGHYVDDVRFGNGLKLTTDAFPGGGYTFDAFGVSSRAEFAYNYNKATISDLQGFLDQVAPGKYEVRGDKYANIYLKGTNIQVGSQWGSDYKDFSTLINDIDSGLKNDLGASASQNYLKSLGKPESPIYSDYFTQYRTPKRQTLKTKPAFKGAEEVWRDAMQKYYEALNVWEAANPDAYKEASKIYDLYLDKKERISAITDLLDGVASGEMGMNIIWGGHDPTYFKTNSRGINEGFANWFQLNFQNDVEMLEYLKKYAPEANRIFEECVNEMMKQTFGW
jgi:SPP1 gp7 family putative phage head morphogenesis protein